MPDTFPSIHLPSPIVRPNSPSLWPRYFSHFPPSACSFPFSWHKTPTSKMADSFDCALDLMRRLPPLHTEQNLLKLITLVPDLTEDLLSTVDQPLKTSVCNTTGKTFLLCDYNRDADSYRSPWSNKFQPSLPDANYPSDKLRNLEILANDAFDTYRSLYFEGGVSSVYLWDLDTGFAGVVLIKKTGEGSTKMSGSWDSIHVFDVATEHPQSPSTYRLTSTVILNMDSTTADSAALNLSGNLTRQSELTIPQIETFDSHLVHIGRMIEQMEITMRNTLHEVYFSKTMDIVNDLRSTRPRADTKLQTDLANELASKLVSRQK
ncbi:capping protein (actin filament) muscle Z-line, beta [Fonticula alba]|uniref:F-actin-capping protein subunit beta n=1 Tax=Fonticula alba TaxID=691883 RepID=A0A058ZAU3_FONAL|nr:capping protein (actin filament) muscle Z-line, beta [Fonticula alba]KCV71540.1 capping protein (actin filament) muscle Z-line, beta [Fonticula alba]|eukprot:XP_009494663.1 capping protein (actin filament) muscle Z-line, beta [Fonticula alba]